MASTTFSYSQKKAVQIYNADSSVVASGVVVDGKMEGLWQLNSPKDERLLEEGYLKAGKKDGTWTTYYANGTKHIVAEYRNGNLTGPFKEYDKEGYLLVDATYKDSVAVGEYKEYYGASVAVYGYNPSRRRKREGQFKAGMLDGEWLSYYESGQLAIKSTYKESQ